MSEERKYIIHMQKVSQVFTQAPKLRRPNATNLLYTSAKPLRIHGLSEKDESKSVPGSCSASEGSAAGLLTNMIQALAKNEKNTRPAAQKGTALHCEGVKYCFEATTLSMVSPRFSGMQSKYVEARLGPFGLCPNANQLDPGILTCGIACGSIGRTNSCRDLAPEFLIVSSNC
jgi:hypothetical protein